MAVTNSELKALVNSMTSIQAIHKDVMTKVNITKAIAKYVPLAISDVGLAWDWRFLVKETDSVSVASQEEYVLRGNNNDCQSIVNIRFGSGADSLSVLDKMEATDFDEWISYRSISDTFVWVPIGDEAGFPKVKLSAAPSTTGSLIRYRYRIKPTLALFPDEFVPVLMYGVAKYLVPSMRAFYDRTLKEIRDRYETTGGEDNPAKLDPRIVAANNRVTRKIGWS